LDVSLPDLIPVKSKSLEFLGEKFDSFNIGLVVQPIKQIHRNVRVPISLTIPYFEYKIEIEKAYSFGWDPKDRIMSSLSVLES
jgi:hypothetical protein